MIVGTIYGVVLNDLSERMAIGEGLAQEPYKTPPIAPVVYIKPRMTVTFSGAPVPVPDDLDELVLSPTIGLHFSRAVSRDATDVLSAIGGACLALDVSEPETNYYRPAIRQRCRDGFLPLGRIAPIDRVRDTLEIVTSLDGRAVHSWSLERLVRPVATLVRDLASFMTFDAGDLLLVGLPGDAPRARAGTAVRVEAAGFSPIEIELAAEALI